jgi:uncharacterized membrane protein YfcA
VTAPDAAIAVGIGLVAGVLSGLFGVGGGIVMTPGIDWFLPVPGIVALETPLPVIFPTSLTGAYTYWRARAVDIRAAVWMAPAGLTGAIGGALLTEVVDARLLLLVTASLLAYQSISILRGSSTIPRSPRRTPSAPLFVAIGFTAGFVSGLLGIGGGIVMVPLLAGWLSMPLKRVLGTSLLTIPALVIPGTAVHAALGNINWAVFAFVTLGAVPGARVGATVALGTAERTLRLAVGGFMLVLAFAYGAAQLVDLLNG